MNKYNVGMITLNDLVSCYKDNTMVKFFKEAVGGEELTIVNYHNLKAVSFLLQR